MFRNSVAACLYAGPPPALPLSSAHWYGLLNAVWDVGPAYIELWRSLPHQLLSHNLAAPLTHLPPGLCSEIVAGTAHPASRMPRRCLLFYGPMGR